MHHAHTPRSRTGVRRWTKSAPAGGFRRGTSHVAVSASWRAAPCRAGRAAVEVGEAAGGDQVGRDPGPEAMREAALRGAAKRDPGAHSEAVRKGLAARSPE